MNNTDNVEYAMGTFQILFENECTDEYILFDF